MPASDSLIADDGRLLEIRRLASVHTGALSGFFGGLSAATRAVFLPHGCDPETLARYAERDRRGRDRAYVLQAGTEVAGYFFLWEFDQPVPLLGLGLADAWQGRGLGRQILRRLITDARAAGRAAVELTTVPGNIRAFNLYQRAGFVHLGDVENIAGDGRIVSEHRMFLPLRSDAHPPERRFGPPG